MTSNSPEHDNPSSTGPDRQSGAGGLRPDRAGAAGGLGRVHSDPSGAERPTSSPSEAPTVPRTEGAIPGGTATGAGITPTDTTKGKGKGKTAGKNTISGGDWNVFRTVVVLVGLVIAGFGAYYLILGTAGLPDTEATPVNPTLENQFRFFSAMMIGVGAAFITIAIKFQWANMLWLVCLMVFVGGIGRVLSWAFSGTPNYVLIILMVVELAFPPALLVWHKYIAKTSDLRREFAQRS
ncbi:DUF4345 domain-containing protein [Arthrobacter sp. NamB2]|uniref:DUF4345 domain-containing protein n=1 Tax=Arthrobacter sp. NamB2 TaxID=2576035 RepID=UPI0010C94D3B|nr:DUF4345 domain-containing protein [Arthrobacter sp. NamB2]TKV27954.1 DUF4345 domain-containing protein [Arthrobacter sp. NamB2]